jgi:hypothetical protein
VPVEFLTDEQADGPGVLNGYRGVVEQIDDRGRVLVAWKQENEDGRLLHRAQLSPE